MNIFAVVIVLLIRREIKLKKLDNFITNQIIFKKGWAFIEVF